MIQAMEKYSSGWRGAPAKGVDGSRRARVQIPLSPLTVLRLKKLQKSSWQRMEFMVIYYSCQKEQKLEKNKFSRKWKKVLDKPEKMW